MVEIDPEKNYYEILKLTTAAASDDLRAAYRRLALQYHPDTGHGDTEQFRLVQEAYEVLSDATYRRAYDRQRVARGLAQTGPVTFSVVQSCRELAPMDIDQRLYVLADLRSRQDRGPARTRLNLALVIDRSTSMRGPRMQNVKMAALDLIESLDPSDRLSVVTFSDRAEVVVASERAGHQRILRSAISAISAAGGTEIYQGLAAGIAQVERYLDAGGVTHVILFTDGRTYGDEERALVAARRAEAAGIGISAFGIGDDWNDLFLDTLARDGGGTSQYIDSASKVRQALKSQVEGLAHLTLRRARLKVHVAPYVKLDAVYRAAPHLEILQPTSTGTVPIGRIQSGESTAVVMELILHQTETGRRRLARLEFEAEDVMSQTPIHHWQDVHATFTTTPEEREIPARMLSALARLSAFRLQERAWDALASGEVEQATRYLQSAATQLFDLGYRELGQAAMLEVGRLKRGTDPSLKGRKTLRYGTRALSTV